MAIKLEGLLLNMEVKLKDDYKEYYESDEDNLDSQSDAKVILFLIIVAVIAATYWVSVQ